MLVTKLLPPTSDFVPSEFVSPHVLRRHVEAFAVPRDYWQQPEANRKTQERLADLLSAAGYRVSIEGEFRNVLALPQDLSRPVPLVCAHLDSVATTPGADDNASGLAVLVESARALADAGVPAAFLAPNAEEHGLLGSQEFVAEHKLRPRFDIRAAHVLEMIGFASDEKGSQHLPIRAPIRISDVGDFLGLAANHLSMKELSLVLRTARSIDNPPKVNALRAYFGMERLFPDIYRSDHAPFWRAGMAAVLWTDTAEFRNANYHARTDTPDTLNYEFMAKVASLLIRSLEGAGERES